MTLFSLYHNSYFLGLVPPALWRDPGHCAAGGWGATERITHPGKTDVHCGVCYFFPKPKHTHFFFLIKNECACVSAIKRFFLVFVWGKNIYIYIFFFSDWQLAWQPHFTPAIVCLAPVLYPILLQTIETPPIHPLIMDDDGQRFAKSPQLHPPFLLLLSKTIIDEIPKGYMFCFAPNSFFLVSLVSKIINWKQDGCIWRRDASLESVSLDCIYMSCDVH